MEQKDIYDKLSKQDVEDRHMMNYDIRKKIEEGRYNPCDGNVIKAQRCNYQSTQTQIQTQTQTQTHTSTKSKKEKSYEEKVNEILEEFLVDEQEHINNLVEREKNLHEIFKQNDKQAKVKKIMEDNER